MYSFIISCEDCCWPQALVAVGGSVPSGGITGSGLAGCGALGAGRTGTSGSTLGRWVPLDLCTLHTQLLRPLPMVGLQIAVCTCETSLCQTPRLTLPFLFGDSVLISRTQ